MTAAAPVEALAELLDVPAEAARALLLVLDRAGWRLDRRPPGPGFDDDERNTPGLAFGDPASVIGLDVPTREQIEIAQLWADLPRCESVHRVVTDKARSWRCTIYGPHPGLPHTSKSGHRTWW